MGNEAPLIFGVLVGFGSWDFFLKNPAMDVWFFELELDLDSEGVGVALLEDLEEGVMMLRCNWSPNRSR